MTEPSAGEQDCLFCRIASGAAGVPLLADRDGVAAFRDIDPKAPTHVLVVPKRHHPDVAALAAADPAVLAALVRTGQEIANEAGDGQFRLVFNTGASAGQSVFHAHGHVLAGRRMTWPPG